MAKQKKNKKFIFLAMHACKYVHSAVSPERFALARGHTSKVMSRMKFIYFFNTNLDYF